MWKRGAEYLCIVVAIPCSNILITNTHMIWWVPLYSIHCVVLGKVSMDFRLCSDSNIQ